jgi:hypothetical protein
MKTVDLKPGSILRRLDDCHNDWWLVLNITKQDRDKDAIYFDFLSHNGLFLRKQPILLNESWDMMRYTIL